MGRPIGSWCGAADHPTERSRSAQPNASVAILAAQALRLGARPWRAWAGATGQAQPNDFSEIVMSGRAWAGDDRASAQADLH
jgi:hypothetical protein